MTYRVSALIPLVFGVLTMLKAQDTIFINNPSFEDRPRIGELYGPSLIGWYDCSPKGQTFVDIQPGFFEVDLAASNGQSYVGMVVRASATVEGFCQLLSKPLREKTYYVLSLDLARSENYVSFTRQTMKAENFNKAAVLKVYGCNETCKGDLLYTSEPVENSNWQKHYLKFKAKKDYKFISFFLDYKKGTLSPYNGNMLMDNLSHIYQVDPDTDPKAFFEN